LASRLGFQARWSLEAGLRETVAYVLETA
jgi:hypothetical protein